MAHYGVICKGWLVKQNSELQPSSAEMTVQQV